MNYPYPFKRLLQKKVEQKKAELITIEVEIKNNLENMHYARNSRMEVREDYLYTSLCKLWERKKRNNRFIKLFGA